jgi:hypothetical protein
MKICVSVQQDPVSSVSLRAYIFGTIKKRSEKGVFRWNKVAHHLMSSSKGWSCF